MAVAVKNTPQASARGPLSSLPIASLLGVVYILVSLAVVFSAIPYLWQVGVATWLAPAAGEFVNVALLGLAMLAAAAVLAYCGARLVSHSAPAGLRAGIFVGLLGILVIGLITKWASLWIEHWTFDGRLFGNMGRVGGIILTAAVGLVLLVLAGRLFFRAGFEQWLIRLEEQGWFSANSYKRSQGQRVRRGTMLGILVLVGAGILTLINRNTLGAGPNDWAVSIPFTGQDTVEAPNDARVVLPKPEVWIRISNPGDWRRFKSNAVVHKSDYETARELLRRSIKVQEPGESGFAPNEIVSQEDFEARRSRLLAEDRRPPTGVAPRLPAGDLVLDRFVYRDLNDDLMANYVKIDRPGLGFKKGEVVAKDKFDAAVQKETQDIEEVEKGARELEEAGQDLNARTMRQQAEARRKALPTPGRPEPASVKTTFASLTLLPAAKFTLPLLLAAATIWLAWRLVNLPVFADFLIATEAEMNKVSWTSRRRLVQDTIVVLTTVVLLTIFLLFADIVWSSLLRGIGVLRVGTTSADDAAGDINQPRRY